MSEWTLKKYRDYSAYRVDLDKAMRARFKERFEATFADELGSMSFDRYWVKGKGVDYTAWEKFIDIDFGYAGEDCGWDTWIRIRFGIEAGDLIQEMALFESRFHAGSVFPLDWEEM